jgi:hypothetical protein
MDIRSIISTYNLWANYVEGEDIPIPICAPTVYGSEWGKISIKAQVDTVPCGRVINTYPLPRNL